MMLTDLTEGLGLQEPCCKEPRGKELIGTWKVEGTKREKTSSRELRGKESTVEKLRRKKPRGIECGILWADEGRQTDE